MEQITMTQEAHEEQRLAMYYQPVVSIYDGSAPGQGVAPCHGVIGFEGLIRMVHPQRGILAPAAFANALDHPRLARRIGCFVLDAVLTQGEQWHRDGFPLRMSMNISARHLLDPEFLNDMRAALAAHPDLAPEMCEIEVTETAPMLDFPKAQETLRACNNLGLRVALDDFGTGSASLSYLQKLPAQTIKVDRSFVRDILNDPRDFAIVAGVTTTANMLGLEVVAEGVETVGQLQLLKTLDCRAMQGYLFSKPMPADEVPGWVESFNILNYSNYLPTAHCKISADITTNSFLVAPQLRVLQCVKALQGKGTVPDRVLGPNDECHCHLGTWLERQKTKFFIPSKIDRLHHDLHQLLRDAHSLLPNCKDVDSIGRRLISLNEQLMALVCQWIRDRG
ncbi:EAL domain-containing protein [Acidithiobacillus ferrooxidans]|uniref:EAL domain-containing protein n=1 Tax=Acidithiobacillus ferrooxidans TaxID=920 RepID=UPI00214ABF10|nr:EAL domain-containing protein [Acidithiobacillus ferrooxidans]MCR2831947.1 EAL domain-containing protein [Acidithiobacillus ferrooxidans]